MGHVNCLFWSLHEGSYTVHEKNRGFELYLIDFLLSFCALALSTTERLQRRWGNSLFLLHPFRMVAVHMALVHILYIASCFLCRATYLICLFPSFENSYPIFWIVHLFFVLSKTLFRRTVKCICKDKDSWMCSHFPFQKAILYIQNCFPFLI